MQKKTFALLLCLCVSCLAIAPALALEPTPFPTFDAVDLLDEEGERVTQEIFAEADVTLVNCWATWCGPCVAELPELAQIGELTDGKVQVVSILTDAVNPYTGLRDDAAIEAMRTLTEAAEVTYPVLMPEGTLLELIGMLQAYPTTFIVDSEGMMRAIEVGSKDAQGWIEAAEAAVGTADETEAVLPPRAE